MLRALKALTVRDVFDIASALILIALCLKALLRENASYTLLVLPSALIFPASAYVIWVKLRDAAHRTPN
ncbi:hypothetical protein C8J35_12026 [Rhizobium sp. PP-F2F-G38]|nr:hypothetical protein C8J37_12126 [Rhizobium sp. PP-WC-1G-195]PYE92733.1 hypothetical protein C8J35_12026 [Rhizobium sp. PP-F2F-G38]TCL89644.1 hypothetical protein C8J38_11111 [Rhizobium sp. PP-WC-2G-219]TCP77254.1 hypothetical protein C8J31_12523 [Rhizobium sp. PP-CC-2G-626]TCQ03341.1 hypothetical protein C8J34_11255 [Rhizobium sp. PP-F2F-G36]